MSDREQWLLLLDAAVLGPYMVFTATQIERPYFRAGMMLAGIGSILLNGGAWLRNFESQGWIGERANDTNGIGRITRAQYRAPAVANPSTYRNPYRSA